MIRISFEGITSADIASFSEGFDWLMCDKWDECEEVDMMFEEINSLCDMYYSGASSGEMFNFNRVTILDYIDNCMNKYDWYTDVSGLNRSFENMLRDIGGEVAYKILDLMEEKEIDFFSDEDIKWGTKVQEMYMDLHQKMFFMMTYLESSEGTEEAERRTALGMPGIDDLKNIMNNMDLDIEYIDGEFRIREEVKHIYDSFDLELVDFNIEQERGKER